MEKNREKMPCLTQGRSWRGEGHAGDDQRFRNEMFPGISHLQDDARVLNGSLVREDVNDHQDGSVPLCYGEKATAVQGQSPCHKDMPRMHWYNSLGWILGGIFILFFGVGMFAGIDESQLIIPILVILALGAGVILVNKDSKVSATAFANSSS